MCAPINKKYAAAHSRPITYEDIVSSQKKWVFDHHGGFKPYDSISRSTSDYEFEIRKMMGKDTRVKANDKYMIFKAASRRTHEIGKNGKTLGDIVREEVEKYLVDMAKPAQLAQASRLPQMDPEAAVRQLMAFAESSDIRLIYINSYMVFGFEPHGYTKYEIELIIPALICIPKARLDEKVGTGITLRDLVKKVGETAISDEVKNAVENILGKK